MTKKRRRDFDDDLMPDDFIDPWPPSDDNEIEERERLAQQEFDDLNASMFSNSERNRNLK